MDKRTFNVLVKSCSKKGVFDLGLVSKLENAAKTEMVYFIVKNRGPVLVQLLTPEIDMSWLEACGYLYRTKGKHYEFVHTCEHKIQ